MKSILKVYKTYPEAVKAYQKVNQKFPNAESDITIMTITFGNSKKIRFNFVDNLEGYINHGYDLVSYDPAIEKEVLEYFGASVLTDKRGSDSEK